VAGEPWALGAVSTAEWSGTPLASVLEQVGVAPSAREVVFEAADGFARSLPVEAATDPDVLLVTAMNGEPLPREHGGPLRLVVPRWYAMASVKWLTRIEIAERPFDGRFQVESYVIDGRPVREMEVRSVITEPTNGADIRGLTPISGFAWTGRGGITKVELSDDGGHSWQAARLLETAAPLGWTRWELEWTPPRTGSATLIARASDSTGRVQPLDQRWTRLGYCNNGAVPTTVNVLALP
jgi:DMSO/TMAO reductase YedYZ molybdopterin-dependent catalytic subunit